jgi:hypothetical protein
MKQIGEYDGSVVYDVYGKIKIYKLKNDFFYLIQQSRSYTVVKINMTTQTATEELKFVGGFFYVTKTDDAIVIWINSAEYPFIAYLSSTKSYLVDIKEFDSFYLYAAENLYLTAHKKAKGRTDNTTSLYKLSVDSLTFVQEGLNSYYLNKNRLYFTNSTYNQAQQVISQQDIMYFDESSIKKLAVKGDFLRFYASRDYIGIQKIGNDKSTYTYDIYDNKTNTLLHSFSYNINAKNILNSNNYQSNIVGSDEYLSFLFEEGVVIFDGKKSYQIKFLNEYAWNYNFLKNGGFLAITNPNKVINLSNLYYIDLKSGAKRLLIGNNTNIRIVSSWQNFSTRPIIELLDAMYLFDNQLVELVKFPTNFYFYSKFGKHWILDNFSKKSIWQYTDGKFIQKDSLWSSVEFSKSIDDKYYYFTSSTPQKGYELYTIEDDETKSLPEIVNGIEGIEVSNIFHFNKKIYVYGFTYTDGFQVWKIGDFKEKPDTKEEENKFKFLTPEENPKILYPNPATELIIGESYTPQTLKIIDSKGSIIETRTVNGIFEVNLSTYQAGTYFFNFSSEKSNITKRVVKH